MNKLLTAFLLVLSIYQIESRTSCLSNGNYEDWVATLKYPQTATSEPYNQFSYLTASNVNQGRLQQVTQALDSQNTWLYETFDQINNNNDLQIIAWNDAWPDGTSKGSGAHAKGVLVLDEDTDTGFYLMHSMPQYPDIQDLRGGMNINIDIPDSASIFAQHVLCVSLTGKQINQVASNNIIAGENVYFTNANSQKYPNFNILSDYAEARKARKNAPIYEQNMITPQWNLITKKYSSKAEDQTLLWDEIVSPVYQRNLFCQTWGRPLDYDKCNSPTVENADTISVNGITWRTSQDHSKYCMEKTLQIGLVCFGDMNRMNSQRKRGGGALCIQNPMVWQAFNVFTKEETCDSNEYKLFTQQVLENIRNQVTKIEM